MNTKYCIVSGLAGFNDFFNTFFKACRKVEFGLNNNIDVRLAICWMGMTDEFWDFFEPTESIKIEKISDIDIQNLDKKKPYGFRYKYHNNHIANIRSLEPDKIEWNYDWEVIVEYFSGQWNYSGFFPKYLNLKDCFKTKIKNIHSQLDNGNYLCLNFRMQEYINTVFGKEADKYRKIKHNEYSRIIEDKIQNTDIKILLCTDSIDLVRKFVDNKRVFSFGYAKELIDRGIDPDTVDRNKGIHMDYHTSIGLSKHDICEKGFTDYFLMATSKILIPSEFGFFGKCALNLKKYLESKDFNETAKTWLY